MVECLFRPALAYWLLSKLAGAVHLMQTVINRVKLFWLCHADYPLGEVVIIKQNGGQEILPSVEEQDQPTCAET